MTRDATLGTQWPLASAGMTSTQTPPAGIEPGQTYSVIDGPAPADARELFVTLANDPNVSDAMAVACAQGLVMLDVLGQLATLTAMLGQYAPVLDQVRERMERPMFGKARR